MDIFDGINNWIAEKEQKMYDSINERVLNFLTDVGTAIWDGFIYILPDIVGLGASVTGGFLMISPIINYPPSKILGWAGLGFIVATSILILAKGM